MRGVMIAVGAALDRAVRLDRVRLRGAAHLLGREDADAAARQPRARPQPCRSVPCAVSCRSPTEYHGASFFVRVNGSLRRHAAAPGPRAGRDQRRDVRHRLDPRHLRHHARPVPGVHVERLRDPRPALAVLRPGRTHGPLPLPEDEPGVPAGLRRRQDAAVAPLPDPQRGFAGDHRRDPVGRAARLGRSLPTATPPP